MHDSKISVLTTEDEIVEALTDGQRGTIIADQTTFYGTMGGQQGDKGTIHSANGEFEVEETIHLQGGKIGHVGVMTKGMLSIGETVTLKVCPKNRHSTSKNHSATHLLQKALRTVLGEPCRAGWFLCRCRTSPFRLYPFLCYDSRGDQKGRGYGK